LFAGYRHAEQELAITAPRCHLGWPALAAVGRAVSGHARGGQVDDRGRTVARLLGPKLSGSVGRRQLPDSDRGRWDGDADRDRAVGPMQIVPSVWRRYSATENADPDSVGDAAVTAGRYLCAGDVDLSRPTALRAAIARYSASESFVSSVLAAERDYRIATGSDPLAPPEPRPVAPLARPAVTPAPTVPAETPLPAARPNVVVSPTPGAEIVAGAPADRVAARVGATAGAPASESSGYGGRGSR
jgi:membrane-bound lytic murein transglycosylase B